MIDVVHPGNTELNQRFAYRGPDGSIRRVTGQGEQSALATEGGDDDTAWLKSMQAADVDLAAIQRPEAGSLILDMSQLRTEPLTSAPRKSTKGKLPA